MKHITNGDQAKVINYSNFLYSVGMEEKARFYRQFINAKVAIQRERRD